VLTKCCKDKLNLVDANLGNEYYYNNIPLCIIDAVFSIGINYNATRNVVKNFCKKQNIERLRKYGSEYPERDQQFSVKDLIALYDKNSLDDITNKYYVNKCRTSTRNGILKSEAVKLFCEVLIKYRVYHFQDLSKVIGNREFEGDIKEIPGQGSGISTSYFYMLAGDDNFIKPDRMIIRFVESCIGSSGLKPDEVTKLIMDTHKELVKEFPSLTPRELDHQIWRVQRNS